MSLSHDQIRRIARLARLAIRDEEAEAVRTRLNRVLEPVYGRVRAFLPRTGGIDFAPLIVLLAVYAARIVVINNL